MKTVCVINLQNLPCTLQRVSSHAATTLKGLYTLVLIEKIENFLLHFLKVHISENLFPKNQTDLSSRTDLAALDSAPSATASHLQVTPLHAIISKLDFSKSAVVVNTVSREPLTRSV